MDAPWTLSGTLEDAQNARQDARDARDASPLAIYLSRNGNRRPTIEGPATTFGIGALNAGFLDAADAADAADAISLAIYFSPKPKTRVRRGRAGRAAQGKPSSRELDRADPPVLPVRS